MHSAGVFEHEARYALLELNRRGVVGSYSGATAMQNPSIRHLPAIPVVSQHPCRVTSVTVPNQNILMSSSATSRSTTPSTNPSQGTSRGFLFIDDTRKDNVQQNVDSAAQKKSIRAQAAKASSQARLDTIRKRAEGRPRAQKPGQGVFAVQLGLNEDLQNWNEPLTKVAVKQHDNAIAKYQAREADVAVHADIILGGAIPVAQAHIGILSQFLTRFMISANASSERPWVTLVMDGATSVRHYGMMSQALQANATAIFANDLQRSEVRTHATKMYLDTIRRLQLSLRSPRWNDPIVMHTCMIVTLFEVRCVLMMLCIFVCLTCRPGYPVQQSRRRVSSHQRSCSSHRAERASYFRFWPRAQDISILPDQSCVFFRHRLTAALPFLTVSQFLMNLHDRRPSFLAEEKWKTIPFSEDCQPKTILEALVDILVEIPGVLAAIEAMKTGQLGHYALVQKGLELAYWVRRLVYDLESWKEAYIWTYPTICTTPRLHSLSLLELCTLSTELIPYKHNLSEALNCYAAAHLILARLAHGMAEKSWLVGTVLRQPHSLHDLVAAITIISERHISDANTEMVSMMVTGFSLRVAQSTEEVQDPVLFQSIQKLLARINREMGRRYNINYSVPKDTQRIEV